MKLYQNKGIHSDPKSLAAFGPGDARRCKCKRKMIRLYSPENESELVVNKSIFDAEGINYFVLNDHFGTLKVGPKIELLNEKIIYVSKKDSETAEEILMDFLDNVRDVNTPYQSRYSIPDKIRMVIETLIFG